jgi:hypothetical protein
LAGRSFSCFISWISKIPEEHKYFDNLGRKPNILIKKELRLLCYLKFYFCKKNKISTMDDYYSRKNKNNQE